MFKVGDFITVRGHAAVFVGQPARVQQYSNAVKENLKHHMWIRECFNGKQWSRPYGVDRNYIAEHVKKHPRPDRIRLKYIKFLVKEAAGV